MQNDGPQEYADYQAECEAGGEAEAQYYLEQQAEATEFYKKLANANCGD